MTLNSAKCELSVVVPSYACDDCLDELYKRLTSSLKTITDNYEIIMVNDASPKEDWKVIENLASQDSRVKAINFSKNCGQHYAITAGLDYSSGNWVVVMDADLQDQPEEIPRLYNKTKDGFDIVFGRRVNRQDNFLKKASSALFYKFYDFLTEQVTDHTVGNFGIYSRTVVDNYCSMRETVRNFSQFVRWLGFEVAYIDIQHAERFSGETSYSLWRMIRLASHTVIALSNKPLLISVQLGFWIASLAFIYSLYLILKYLVYGITVTGWTSLMVSVYFLAGLILMNIGILGLYIGKIFDEVKKRPLYVVKETRNFK